VTFASLGSTSLRDIVLSGTSCMVTYLLGFRLQNMNFTIFELTVLEELKSV